MSKRKCSIQMRALRLVVGGLLSSVFLGIPVQAEPLVAKQEPIPDEVWEDMRGKSWKPNMGCPSRNLLVLLTVPYRNFAGQPAMGELVVAKSVGPLVVRIFTEIFESETFRIERIERVDKHGNGSDAASMAANNTSAFNCRFVARTTRLSAHGLGIAVDINPVQNPWVKGDRIDPPAGQPFDSIAKRQAAHDLGQQGIILAGDAVTSAFTSRRNDRNERVQRNSREGWRWGGDWSSPKDYQHFSENGR
jgi:hypothetical protein